VKSFSTRPPADLLARISALAAGKLSRRQLLSRAAAALAGAVGAMAASILLPHAVVATCLISCVTLPGCPTTGCVDSYKHKCYNSCEHYYFYTCHTPCEAYCYFQGC
jgi:hypothetical protein